MASFLGEAVLLPATVDGTGAATALGHLSLYGVPLAQPVATVLLRPEQLHLVASTNASAHGDGDGGTTATVVRHDFHGHDALVWLRLADGTEVTARIQDSTPPVAVGDRVTVSVRGPARVLEGGDPY